MRENMIRIEYDVVRQDRCTGCGACFNACPRDAIKMKYDEEGFQFPVINNSKCVECEICSKACPEYNSKWEKLKNSAQMTCYATMADNEIRMKSSSGGMFTILANHILEQNGYVCGAVYADNYERVEHVLIHTKEELTRIRGSKYVQSDTKKVYTEIKQQLEEGKYVLFSGCPCQVAGLYSFLDKYYDRLFTVDLVCHAANSLYAYQSFIHECAKGRSIKEVNFRDKSIHGWSTPATIYFKDGTMYDAAWNKSPFYTAFWGIMNRKCCGTCHYADLSRVGDITLGDFWKVQDWDPSCNDWKGTSLVIINTEHGKLLYSKIREKLVLEKEAPIEMAVKHNGQLVKPQKTAPGRRFFFHHLKKDGFHKAIWYGQKYRYDVGLVGWWFAANYGSVLTYYALGNILQDMDMLPILIKIPKIDGTPWEEVTNKNINFLNRFFPVSKDRSYSKLNECNRFCDAFMTGSDQLWVSNYIKVVGYTFFLDFVDSSKKKIAYATSLGYEKFDGTEEECAIASTYLNNFDFLSVREKSGIEACKNSFGVDAVRTLDPVFLCDIDHYDKLADSSRYNAINENYLMCYILDPSPEKEEAINYLQRKLGINKKVVFDMKNYDSCKNKWTSGDYLENVSIEDFLCLIKKSKFLITDSHHGICFALIYQKNFICIANAGRGLTRFESLFDLLDIKKHLVYSAREIIDNEILMESVDYSYVNNLLDHEKRISKEWLINALNNRKEKKVDKFVEMIKKVNSLQDRISILEQKIGKNK